MNGTGLVLALRAGTHPDRRQLPAESRVVDRDGDGPGDQEAVGVPGSASVGKRHVAPTEPALDVHGNAAQPTTPSHSEEHDADSNAAHGGEDRATGPRRAVPPRRRSGERIGAGQERGQDDHLGHDGLGDDAQRARGGGRSVSHRSTDLPGRRPSVPVQRLGPVQHLCGGRASASGLRRQVRRVWSVRHAGGLRRRLDPGDQRPHYGSDPARPARVRCGSEPGGRAVLLELGDPEVLFAVLHADLWARLRRRISAISWQSRSRSATASRGDATPTRSATSTWAIRSRIFARLPHWGRRPIE